MSLFSRDDCVSCGGSAPSCNCAKGEQCILTSRYAALKWDTAVMTADKPGSQNLLAMPYDTMHPELIVFFGRWCQPRCHCWARGGCACDCKRGAVLVVEEEKGE